MTLHDDHRKRPRRRGDALVSAILEAAVEELEEKGYAGLTMESVAQRAGASKASLYRRWEGRAELAMDAAYALAPLPEQIPDTGHLRTDLLEVLRQITAALSGPAGEALRGVFAEALPEAGRATELRARSQGRSRKLLTDVLQRAADRGEISREAILPARVQVAPAMLRNYLLLESRQLDDALLAELVDDVLLPLFRSTPSE